MSKHDINIKYMYNDIQLYARFVFSLYFYELQRIVYSRTLATTIGVMTRSYVPWKGLEVHFKKNSYWFCI